MTLWHYDNKLHIQYTQGSAWCTDKGMLKNANEAPRVLFLESLLNSDTFMDMWVEKCESTPFPKKSNQSIMN